GAALLIILSIASRIAAIGAGVSPALSTGAWATLLLLPVALVGLSALAAQGALLLALRRAP
ncbi:MAG: cell division protein, partial [Sphingomonas sp.]|nr:cell division protein [Sphingomonas sp.]